MTARNVSGVADMSRIAIRVTHDVQSNAFAGERIAFPKIRRACKNDYSSFLDSTNDSKET